MEGPVSFALFELPIQELFVRFAPPIIATLQVGARDGGAQIPDLLWGHGGEEFRPDVDRVRLLYRVRSCAATVHADDDNGLTLLLVNTEFECLARPSRR